MNSQIETFIHNVGMLPVPLLHNQADGLERYALLNGSTNNLCADADFYDNEDVYRAKAWSTGNNYYLILKDDTCNVLRFDNAKVQLFDAKVVLDNAEKFVDYLGRNNLNYENKIIPYVLRTYREIRNEIGGTEGIDSLRVLLYLLAYYHEKDNFDLEKWGLNEKNMSIAKSIVSWRWDMIYDNFSKGLILNGKRLQPDIELILRHTAGKLFEEANYIAYLPVQQSLFPDERIRYSVQTSQDGAFFTPAYVARSIVEESLNNFDCRNKDSIIIFDPACGASGFLVEALRQLKKKGYKKEVKVIARDKAATAVEISNFVLHFEKQEWGDSLILDVKQCDSLSEDCTWPSNVDILLMNPPFLSWEKMSYTPDLQKRISDIVGKTGRLNLASAFLAKAIDSISPFGVLGAVLPSSILNDQTYVELRNKIREEMSLRVVGNLGSYVFETVQTYTSMFIAAKDNDYFKPTTILWTNNMGGIVEKGLKALRKYSYTNAIEAKEDYTVYTSDIPKEASSWKIGSYLDLHRKGLIELAVKRGTFKHVRNLFNVKLGARTGANKIFLLDLEEYNLLGEKEKFYFRPVVDNLTLCDGRLSSIRYIFYPNTAGLEQIKNEEELSERVPCFYQKSLKPNKELLSNRKSLHGKNWWELSEACIWQEKKSPKFVSTEFGHSGSFAIDVEGDFVVERGCLWELTEVSARSAMKLYRAYMAVFNSSLFDEILRIYGSQLSGGTVYKLVMSAVEKMPVPDLQMPEFAKFLPKLVAFGDSMTTGEYWDEEELNLMVKKMLQNVL